MTRPDDREARAHTRASFGDLPIDPDVDAAEDARHRPYPRQLATATSPWPRLSASVLTAVFLGGCVGGYARYAVTQAWSTSKYGFPWSTFAVNVSGSFVLAIVIVMASEMQATRYLRPLLGTGFCGAFTTFSSVVVAVAQLIAHDRDGTAATYLTLSTVASLAAAAFGLVCGRALAAVAVSGETGP